MVKEKMRLFTTISIEIGSKCNRRCWFCPNTDNKRPDEFMSKKDIKSILKQLGEINYDKRIELYIYNEPLRDKRLLKIIKWCRKIVPKSTIMIATNGDYIKSTKQVQTLFDNGLNQLQVNVYSNEDRFDELSAIVCKTTASCGTNVYENTSVKKQVYSIERKYGLTRQSIKIGRFELTNRAGNVKVPCKPILNKTCVRPFRFMQINWKGEVIICCNDYHAEVICGNIHDNTILHIWEQSDVYKKYRKYLLDKNRRKLKLCNKCSFNGGAYTYLIFKQWNEKDVS